MVRRLLWSLVQLPFWPCVPRRFFRWRILLLRLFGAKIGANCMIGRGVRIWMPWNLEMGDWACLGDSTEVYNFAPVYIGAHTVVSQYSYLCTATHDHTDPTFPLIWKPIHIGSKCWVATGVFVAPGTTIGEGAVIGAKSLVSRDLPPWYVCVGSPCRPVKPRILKTSGHTEQTQESIAQLAEAVR